MNEIDSSTPPVKTCTKCGRKLSTTPEFFFHQNDGRNGLRADCKDCHSAVNRVSQQRHYVLLRAERLANPQPVDKTGWIQCPYCPDLMPSHHDRKQCGKPECKRARNRDRGREYLREWTKTHGQSYAMTKYPEKRRAESRAYKLEHPEERREQRSACGRRRRAIKLGINGTHTTADVRAQYERQHGKCIWRKVNPECAVSLNGGYHIDHVIPLAGERTSSNGPENIVLACPKCNGSKGAKDPMDWAGVMF